MDPKGFLAYLGLKDVPVLQQWMPSFRQFRSSSEAYGSKNLCNNGCHPFGSLEAVQKHMEAKIFAKCIMVTVVMMKRWN
ncbi:hypothetical protein P3S68_011900 [Capsicum galapagoense]